MTSTGSYCSVPMISFSLACVFNRVIAFTPAPTVRTSYRSSFTKSHTQLSCNTQINSSAHTRAHTNESVVLSKNKESPFTVTAGCWPSRLLNNVFWKNLTYHKQTLLHAQSIGFQSRSVQKQQRDNELHRNFHSHW